MPSEQATRAIARLWPRLTYLTQEQAAELIDRETGLPMLANALQKISSISAQELSFFDERNALKAFQEIVSLSHDALNVPYRQKSEPM